MPYTGCTLSECYLAPWETSELVNTCWNGLHTHLEKRAGAQRVWDLACHRLSWLSQGLGNSKKATRQKRQRHLYPLMHIHLGACTVCFLPRHFRASTSAQPWKRREGAGDKKTEIAHRCGPRRNKPESPKSQHSVPNPSFTKMRWQSSRDMLPCFMKTCKHTTHMLSEPLLYRRRKSFTLWNDFTLENEAQVLPRKCTWKSFITAKSRGEQAQKLRTKVHNY